MINKQFPSSYDVEQTIRFRTTPFENLKKFTQSQGLIIVGKSKEHLAQFASNVFFEHRDYVYLRNLAQGANVATNISGFVVRPIIMPIKIEELRDDIVAMRSELHKMAQSSLKKGLPSEKFEMPQLENGKIRMRYEYQRVIPGRVELLQRVDTEVDFEIEPTGSPDWRVICYPQANQDVKRVEDLFRKMGNGAYEPLTISLEFLSQKQRIQFFDDLIDYYTSHDEWKFLEVTEITMRRMSADETTLKPEIAKIGDENLGDDEIPSDEDVQEVSQDDLLSITQAIFKGNRLRNNSFVRRSEKQGFYFPSMTLALENKKEPEVIQITIRFKLSPRMFEVILAEMGQKTEMGEIPTVFEPYRQQEILREFWDTAHKIWQPIYEHAPGVQQLGLFAGGKRITDALVP